MTSSAVMPAHLGGPAIPNRRWPLYKFLRPEHADRMLQEGSIRIGTLHEYRNQERYGQRTLDAEEGQRTIHVHGPRTLDHESAELIGITLNCPGAMHKAAS